MKPDVLYYTIIGEQMWEFIPLLFERSLLSFWGERRPMVAPPLEFFDRLDDLDDPDTPFPSSDSDEVGSRAPSDGSDDPPA